MANRLLAALDVGGGGTRCLLVDADSARIASATRRLAPARDPELPTAMEFDPGELWLRLGECVREALATFGASPDDVVAVAATSMRHASALVGADGDTLLVTTNQDARGLADALGLAAESGAELHRRTGHWPNPVQAAGRLLWLAANDPERFGRASSHLSLSSWLAFRLCGERAEDPSQASETGLFDLATRDWAGDWIERLALPRDLFPPVAESGTRLGELDARAAAELGLQSGIPVAVGAGDTQCGLLGAGVVQPGQLGIVAGTTAPVQIVSDEPVLDPEARLWTAHHAVPGRWVVESNGGGLGAALAWIAELLHPDSRVPVVQFLAEAAESSVGAAGMVSSLGAEVMDARAIGLPIGNLTMSYMAAADDPARRRHLARAVVEGLAFAVRANTAQAEAAAGAPATALRLAGGVSRSAFFTQLLADVLGRPIDVARNHESTALGAALCAGVAAGIFRDLPEAAAALAEPTQRREPGDDAAPYDELFEAWDGLRRERAASDATAAGIAVRGLLAPSGAPTATADSFRPRILVTAEMDDAGLDALREIGDVEHQSFKRAMRLLTGPSLVAALEGVQVFVTEVDVLDAVSLADAPDLRIVAVCRGDAVNVALDACTRLKIPVINTPGRNADAVADLALAYFLMLARRLPEAGAFLREPGGEAGDMGRMGRAFGSLQGRELGGKIVGLVGMGAVGRKVIERLRPFGAHCLVADPFVAADQVRLAGAEPVSLPELLATSDFVSLHAAVTEETTGLIGSAELAQMRPGSFLVNTARAALLDEPALRAALESGHLGGAALDVFAVEPPASDDPLLALPNVIATPHVGGNTAEVAGHQGRIVAADLARLRAGAAPRHALNPEVLDAFEWSAPRPAPSAALRAELAAQERPAVTDLQKKSKPKALPPAAAPAKAAPLPAEGPVAELRRTMERIVAAFVAGLGADPGMAEAAADREVILHFTLTDLDLEYHFGFAGGGVVAALGAPAEDAEVQLKMRADMMDGMFTGRLNAMQAAMNGELSFSGDTAKAMTLTQIQPDLSRVYQGVIDELGPPGDLASIPAPDVAAPAADSGAAAAAATGGATQPTPAGPPRVGDVRDEIVDIVDELYTSQLITATGGNVSARGDAPGQVWITPSQLFKGELHPEVLVRIGMDGRAIDTGTRSPSSEALMHTAVLEAKPEAQAVIHCHAANATVLANTGLPFLPISTEAAFLVNIGRIPFIMPGTRDLADAVVEAMGDGWAVLMANHGLLVAGRSLRRAADMAEIIERTAEVLVACHAVGREPSVLPEETVETLSKMGDLMA